MDWQEGQVRALPSGALPNGRPNNVLTKDIACNCSYLDLLSVSTDGVSHAISEKLGCPQLHSIPQRPP